MYSIETEARVGIVPPRLAPKATIGLTVRSVSVIGNLANSIYLERMLWATPMRVVFLNRFFFPDHAPTGVLVSDLAFFLLW